jgi:hypothetical protein
MRWSATIRWCWRASTTCGGNEAWVLVDVAIGDDYGTLDHWKPYAIWRNTGNVYRVERGGAVEDDPIFEPAKSLDL